MLRTPTRSATTPSIGPMLPCRKYATRGCRPAELSVASSLATGVLWLWLVPPHIARPRIVHVNTDSTETRPHIHLPLDEDLELPQTLQPRAAKTRASSASTSDRCSCVTQHPLPLASAWTSHHPWTPTYFSPYLYCKQTPAASFRFGSAFFLGLSWTCAITQEHPRPRQIHRTQPPESSTS
jgi:hypothetical protein